MQPLGIRLRAAIEALPFEALKLSALAAGHMLGEDFATRRDRAIAKSRAAKTFEGPTAPSASQARCRKLWVITKERSRERPIGAMPN